jgi:outer membrane protein OmpA-like peptidoglycan-associated protein
MADAKHDNHGKKDAGHGAGGGHGGGHGGGRGSGQGDDGHKKKKHGHGGGHGGGGHGGEEHEGAPEWLISFADMVMLMMGFFVILFAMNVQPKGGNPGGGGEQSEGVAQELNMVDLAIAVRRAFNNDVNLDSTDPKDQPLIERIKQLEKHGAGTSRDEGTEGKDRNVQSVRPGERFGRGTSVAFASGSSELTKSARTAIDELAKKLDGQTPIVEVYGHVGAHEAVGEPAKAMELSVERAMVVATRLAAGGLDFWRIRIRGAGDGDRVEPFPTGAAGDARNQRVEIRVLDEAAPPKERTRPVASPLQTGRRAE